jgi:hypothetical protein
MKRNQAPQNIFGDLRISWKYDDAAECIHAKCSLGIRLVKKMYELRRGPW